MTAIIQIAEISHTSAAAIHQNIFKPPLILNQKVLIHFIG